MKIYIVKHRYGVDGGFGDYVDNETTVCAFSNEEDAKLFCCTYSDVHVYDRPYAELDCGELFYEEMELVAHDEFDISKIKWVTDKNVSCPAPWDYEFVKED